MAELSATRRFLLLLRSNRISWTGAIITTFAFVAIVMFLLLETIGIWRSPYLGMVTFLILPGIFVLGLLLIPLGLFVYRHHLKERIAEATSKPMHLIRWILGLTAINVVIVATAGYRGVHYMDSVEFCGLVCHTVMEPQYVAYLDSPHARVNCVECHIGPGASFFVKSKLDGVRQVVAVALGTYETPIPTPVHTLRPARETCEQCHWPDKFSGDRLVVRQHFKSDVQNTPYTNVLVLKTGGTRPDGTPSGVHWHIHKGIEVSYVATDENRLEIPWVKLVDRTTGREEIFTVEGQSKTQPEGELRTMDCIDCHNQPSHTFRLPWVEVNEAMADGRISPRIPFIKKAAVEVLEANEGRTRDNAAASVRQALHGWYEGRDLLGEEHVALLDSAAEILGQIWLRNIFPEMAVDWGTYRGFDGHFGCVRCHDDLHANDKGETIPIDCGICHVTLAFQQRRPEILDQLGLHGGLTTIPGQSPLFTGVRGALPAIPDSPAAGNGGAGTK